MVLGQFGAPFGVVGWVKLQSYTEPPERILGYPSLRAGAGGGEVAVREWKRVGKGQLAVRIVLSGARRFPRLCALPTAFFSGESRSRSRRSPPMSW